ncbi:DUF58 domain-containing protein [Kribbella sandramycini]|uniref:DUF58 domain-containing protein n=1 Tax=Kribbella sandramycini TaxID=60450 RepID=A0A7Y4P0X1_9ACTN|nr:DUF58 domain-containing protein [Kribbella sandramycini]MBB6566234.1 uncharacterized protein (DUF58 family) [Kribbella sandramycini]NOL43101.1 DUF58 domain-containing protein [Kribbella sandramycini]
MRLTGRGIAVLVSSLALYGLGELAGYAVFRALAGIGLGAVLAAVVLTLRQPQVTVHRVLSPDRVERGRPALATLRVRNDGTRRQASFAARDSAGDAWKEVRVRQLGPGIEATYRYELPTSRRGRIEVGPLTLERRDPLGLTRNSKATGEVGTLWVHPQRHPTKTVVAGRPRHHHVGRTADDSLRGSADLRDVRPYVVGDEVRHLHWKATARTGQLMVRDYADPDQPRLTVLLDTRTEPLPAATFEEAVEVAASILVAASAAGHRCRFVTTAGADFAAPGGAVASRLFLDELCIVQQRDDAGLVPAVLTTGTSAGGAIVVVTGARGSAADLAPLLSRYSSVTAIGLGPLQGVAPILGAQVVLAATAREALQQWTGVLR